MSPKTRQNDEIAVYRLRVFPDWWEKVKVLLVNVQCVDTTFCTEQGEIYMFTFQTERAALKGNFIYIQIEGEKISEVGRFILPGIEKNYLITVIKLPAIWRFFWLRI